MQSIYRQYDYKLPKLYAPYIPLQATASATLNVEVMLHSYSNPTSEDCDGGNCEGLIGTCDNVFTFCLRTVGGSSCLARITTDELENDDFTFTPTTLDALGISNPLVFSNIAVMVRIYTRTTDLFERL